MRQLTLTRLRLVDIVYYVTATVDTYMFRPELEDGDWWIYRKLKLWITCLMCPQEMGPH